MDNSVKNEGKQPITKKQTSLKQNAEQNIENEADFNLIEISQEQKKQQISFLKQFTEFSPSKSPKFLSKEYEFRLTENIQINLTLFQDTYQLYNEQLQNAEHIKNKILSRLKDIDYSMDHLSIISNFFQSYSSFQESCNTAKIILTDQNFPNTPYQVFEHSILLNILDTHRRLFLKNLLFKFKHFPLIKRKDILKITVDRYVSGIKKDNTSIPLLSNQNDHIANELSRLSQHLGIEYDIEKYDGQHFQFECETILSEYQRLHFSFNKVEECQPKAVKMIDFMNKSLMETFSKDDLVIEAFQNIIQPSDNYKTDLFTTLSTRTFPKELISCWISLRFCRNRQLLSEIEKSTTKLFECYKKIYDNFQIELSENERTFCDKYISFMIEQLLVFSSAVYVKNGRKADLDKLIEISLEKNLRYTNSKIKILSIFSEISRHSNSPKIKEFADMFINRRPNFVFTNLSFFELFETQIETLETISKCLSIIVNIQILNERQMTSFYGTFFEPFQFGLFYSNQGEGEFNISKFEVYLSIEKVLNFVSMAPKIVDEICISMSIRSIDFSDYVELAVWTQLLNEINQYPENTIFGTDFSALRFNLPISKDVESLINCQLLDDPLFVKNFGSQIDESSKTKFTQNLAIFCSLAFKLRSLIYKTNLYLSLYLEQYSEFKSEIGYKKTIEFISKSFNFSNYEEIQKLCLNGDFSEIIEIVNCQRRYNITLMIALQYNNFRSDNEYISILFYLTQKDSVFAITTSETTTDEKAKFYREAAKRFFVGFDSLFNQDFHSIIFDINEVLDYANAEYLAFQLKKYVNRIELATITNCERILLHDFQQIELFSLHNQFYRPNDEIFDYFAIPSCSQCLLLECESKQFDQVLSLVATRLELIGFIRFNSFIKSGRKKSFSMLYNKKILLESSFLSKLNSVPLKPPKEALSVLQSGFVFEMGRFELSTLLLLQKIFQRKKDSLERFAPITDNEVRNFWRVLNQESDESGLAFNYISIERYIPVFLSCLNFTFSDDLKTELFSQIDTIDSQISQEVTFNDPQNSEAELSKYVMRELMNEIMKLTLLRLHTKCSLSDIKVATLADITKPEYKENLHFYGNFFVVPGTPRLPKIVENELLSQPILELVEKAQKAENEIKSAKMAEKLKDFDSISSPLKPDFYIAKSDKSTQKQSQHYNPSPENAVKQFEQEMRYANGKIISMMVQSIGKSIISDKPVIFSTSSKVVLNFDQNALISKLNPLSSFLSLFLQYSKNQVLKTWLSYNEQMRETIAGYDTGGVLVRLFKENFKTTFNFRLVVKYFNDFVKLAKLRENERTTNKEHAAYEREILKQIHDEYEEQLSKIADEQNEVLKQFPVVRNRLIDMTQGIIQKQKDLIPENEKLLEPKNEMAKKSLELSKKMELNKKSNENVKNDDNLHEDDISSSSSDVDMKPNEEEESEEKFPSFSAKRNESNDQFPSLKVNGNMSNDQFPSLNVKQNELSDRFPSLRVNGNESSEQFPSLSAKGSESNDRFPSMKVNRNESNDQFPSMKVNRNESNEQFPSLSAKGSESNDQFPTMRVNRNESNEQFPSLSAKGSESNDQFPSMKVNRNQSNEQFPSLSAKGSESNDQFPSMKVNRNESNDQFPSMRVNRNESNEQFPSLSAKGSESNDQFPSMRVNRNESNDQFPSMRVNRNESNDQFPSFNSARNDSEEQFPSFSSSSTAFPARPTATMDDFSVVFTPQQPPPQLSSNSSTQFRRHTMIRPTNMAPLIETPSDKKAEPPKPKPNAAILAHIESSKKKYKLIEEELPDLRKEILKLRVSRCLFKIGVTDKYQKMINTVSREKKESSTMFWSNRKLFSEDLRQMNDKIDNCCKRLSTAENEIERLKSELEEQKKATTKLAHWKELNLKTSDQIIKQISAYEKGPNIDVNKLLTKLIQKRDELDILYMEADHFEEEFYYNVTEPLKEISRARRYINNQKYQTMKMQETMNNQEDSIEDQEQSKIQEILDENRRLKIENQKLLIQISQFEKKDDQVPPIQIDTAKEVVELPQLPSVRRLRASYVQSARGRPTPRTKSPYAKYGYRTITRPKT